MGDTGFPYVEIPERLVPKLGLPDPGTRVYRAFGPREAFSEWHAAVSEVCGPDGSVSPGGVSMFVKASRAGVYKRLKEGRLTAFCFHVETTRRTRFRKRELIETSGHPYTDIPVSECKAWAQQLRGLEYREVLKARWGDGDHAGQFLIRETKRPADSGRKQSNA